MWLRAVLAGCIVDRDGRFVFRPDKAALDFELAVLIETSEYPGARDIVRIRANGSILGGIIS